MDTINVSDEDLNSFHKTISANVLKIRKLRKVSQLELATTIGHSSGTFIGKAELLADNKHFNLEQLYKISLALDVNICEFFKPIN